MPKRILIVEDQMSTRDALTKLVALRGHVVESVSDGLEYLAAVSQKDYDLILTDLKMPNLSGEVATKIMKLRGDKTPVLALTGLSEFETKQIQDVFTRIYYKPIDFSMLIEHVESLLE